MSDSKQHPTNQNSEEGRLDRRQLLGSAAGLAFLGLGGQSLASSAGKPLVLKHDHLRTNIADLFSVLRRDSTVRGTFIKNPTEVILTSLIPEYRGNLASQRLSEANRFLFSLLANPEFRGWASDYQQRLNREMARTGQTPENLDRAVLMQDMAGAMAKYGESDTMISLMNRVKAATEDDSIIDDIVTVETAIAVVAVLIVVIVLIDFNGPEEEDTTKRLRMTAAEMRGLADHLTRHASELKRSGRLGDPKAEIF